MDFKTRYAKLNEKQREAVDHIDGPVMVVAGPGTGKTELLSMRTANILRRTDALPENILCLTFTESGANAMRKRLKEIIGADAYRVPIHTFHSFGSEIISLYGEYFYHGANFRPASDLSSYELLRSIFDTLEHANPLSSKMNDEYTHLPDALTTISELKKSGFTNEELLRILDANDSVFDTIEKTLADAFGARVSTKTATALAPVCAELAELKQDDTMPPGVAPISNVLALSLARAIDEAIENDSSKPITAWKSKHMEKDERGSLVFKDRKKSRKLRALSYVYYQYLMKMQEAELYDFDDMVLRIVHALEVFPDLLANLQEKYLYIMVDEFQDTNLAQSRILHSLASIPSGDAPNVMIVGDDDQAIYSFQGADIGNIREFYDRYEQTHVVTLVDNYRSASSILERSREVIIQGSNRLEATLKGIDKTLIPHWSDTNALVELTEYQRPEDERRNIARNIKVMITKGADPSSIAILARRHHELIAMLPYLASEGIPVNYERRDNVLESDIIIQLVELCRVVCYLADGEVAQADSLIPRIIAHPAWNYSNEEVWNLSLNAYKHRGSWLEQMNITPVFQPLHEWLFNVARMMSIEPAERAIDTLIGTPNDIHEAGTFRSPLYGYFFSEERRTEEPDAYVTYLEALRTIRAKLREYRPDQPLALIDFVDFIDLHKDLGSSITSVRVRADKTSAAIHLMTAHKSKGLEFDTVFIIGAIDTSWGERVRTRSRLIDYPENLPLKPSGDSLSERLRLFFVAMTRARSTLSISYAASNTAGSETMIASFLSGDTWSITSVAGENNVAVLEEELRSEWYQPLLNVTQPDMQRILAPVLENYKLSITHLTSFLDVTRGGPQAFLVNHLLRFPVAKKSSALYGSAIHLTLQRAHNHVIANGVNKPEEDVLQDFESILSGYHMPNNEYQAYLQRGTASLHAFLTAKYQTFNQAQRVELSFSGQQSVIGEAVLTGALDLVEINEADQSMTVTDYKTGHPTNRWQGKSDGEKLKLHTYKQQLLFYKLLVEHSRDYRKYTVNSGVLQFIEPSQDGQIYDLDLEMSNDDVTDISKLIEVVYRLICKLSLPDTSMYPPTYAGVKAFEQDLLNGTY